VSCSVDYSTGERPSVESVARITAHEAGMSNETNNSRVVVDPSLILTIEERDGDCRVVPPCAGSGGSDRDTYRRKIHQLDPVDSPRTLTSDWQPRTKWVGRFAAG
jgi:hypothetical protein